jgi:hypothetical protein
MKAFVLTIGLMTAGVSYCSAQVPGASDSLRAQASRMANAFVTADYTTFLHYMHPKIVQISGGQQKMKETLTQMVTQMNTGGMTFSSVTVDSASAFIKTALTLQATIKQHTTVKLPSGRSMATSTLIGMSSDNGAHWKFVDTHNKTIEDMRKALPNLSAALVIPPTQPPVHYDQ